MITTLSAFTQRFFKTKVMDRPNGTIGPVTLIDPQKIDYDTIERQKKFFDDWIVPNLLDVYFLFDYETLDQKEKTIRMGWMINVQDTLFSPFFSDSINWDAWKSYIGAMDYNDEFLYTQYTLINHHLCRMRDSKRCQKCGKNDRVMVAHHLRYDHYWLIHRHLDDLLTLCKECHDRLDHSDIDFTKRKINFIEPINLELDSGE